MVANLMRTFRLAFLFCGICHGLLSCSTTQQQAEESLNVEADQSNTETANVGYDETNVNSEENSGYEDYNAVIDDVESTLNSTEGEIAEYDAGNQSVNDQINDLYSPDVLAQDSQYIPVDELNNQPSVDANAFASSVDHSSTSSQMENSKEVSPNVTSLSKLWWVGYDYRKKDKQVNVEILVDGKPKFKLKQQRNRANQPELVIQFENTRFRRKLVRDIDASEFASPVAYVRMRQDWNMGIAEVILTIRDQVRPRMDVKKGGLLLSFDIPDRYLGLESQEGKAYDHAISLHDANVMPVNAANGEDVSSPDKVYAADSGNPVFTTLPDQGIDVLEKEGSAAYQAVPQETKVEEAEVQVLQEVVEKRNLPTTQAVEGEELTLPNRGPAPAANKSSTFASPRRPLPKVDQPTPGVAISPQAQPVYPVTQPMYLPPGVTQNGGPTAVMQAPPAQGETGSDYELEDSMELEDPSLNEFDSDDTGDAADNFEVKAKVDDTQFIFVDFVVHGVAQDSGYDVPATGDSDSYYGYEDGSQLVADSEIIGQDQSGTSAEYSGKPIQLNFTDAKLDHVLKVFAQESGYNFVVPQRIGQQIRVSLNLKNVPWDMALKAVLESEGLAMTRIGDRVIRVDKIANVNDYLQAEDKAKKVRAAVTPQKVLILRLNHARATDLLSSVRSFMDSQSAANVKSNVAVDTRTNSLILESLPEILVKAQAVVDRLDVPVPQAEISTRIVEVSKGASNFLGLNWQGGSNYDAGSGLGFGSLTFPNFATSNFAIDTGQTTTAGDFRLRLGSINDVLDLDLRLKMEERKGTAEILQSGKVVVQDGKSASIKAGTTVYTRPVVVAGVSSEDGANQAGELQPIEFTLNLVIGDAGRGISISREGRVTMPILIENSLPNSSNSALQADTRKLQTEIVKNTGETAVIGGIYNTSKRENVIAIPFLSKIPILGALFRSKEYIESQTELLIMITPTVIEAYSDKDMGTAGTADVSGYTFDYGNENSERFGASESNVGDAYETNESAFENPLATTNNLQNTENTTSQPDPDQNGDYVQESVQGNFDGNNSQYADQNAVDYAAYEANGEGDSQSNGNQSQDSQNGNQYYENQSYGNEDSEYDDASPDESNVNFQ